MILCIHPHLSSLINGIQMSFQKFKVDSYSVGGRHRYAPAKIFGDITSKVNKLLNGFCSKCNRKKSMTAGDITIQADV